MGNPGAAVIVFINLVLLPHYFGVVPYFQLMPFCRVLCPSPALLFSCYALPVTSTGCRSGTA